MFQIYINNMQECLSSYINLFAYNTILLRVIRNNKDCMELQKDIDKIWDWSQSGN
ncbi:hypothetical protein E2C01_064256 [Portunus trituberculatus]|uniref:Uncharacterized protein n=1 Tax=Portunus trituberculatus TaxID=210409 RepID=A0A5B7HB80_PORTR|nr:hypothetical protein [Portunus trituberculatus]